MTNSLTGVLVGAHFRPPAKLILECLPSGAPLSLIAEPDNPYDSNAIQVHVKLSSVPESQFPRLQSELSTMGWDFADDFLPKTRSGETLQIGFLASGNNKKAFKDRAECSANSVFLEAQALKPWSECKIVLAFGPDGQALVVLTAEDDPQLGHIAEARR